MSSYAWNITLVIVLCVVLFCVAYFSAGTTSTSKTAKIGLLENISYIQDKRTGLCFAVITNSQYNDFNTISFTNVPCSNLSESVLGK